MASMALSFSLSSSPLPSAVTLPTHKNRFMAPLSIRRRSYSVQMSKSIDQEEINHPEVFRPLGKFPPSIWGDTFANYTLDTELREKYSLDIAELKKQVRSMLILEECKVSEKIILIDTLERLGVAYHFENDIEELLQQLFDNYDYNEDYDLFNVALQFRIFRQHGHNMSCDIFRKYKGSDGKLQETLENDVMGMLSMYEAAHLAMHGEDILDEALVFTKTRLRTMLPKLSSHFAKEVKRSLEICLHRRVPRVEARIYIEVYERNPLRNETLLYFAKIDFNLVQMLHLEELSTITKWWNEIQPQLPHVRDRVNEMYFWGLGVYFEPHHTVARITYVKNILMHLLLDDTFDSYGTLDELKLFTDAVEVWDANAIHLIPDYFKILYKCLLDLFEEFDHHFMAQGGYRGLSCVKKETQNLVKSYYKEAKWCFKVEEMPSFDEYWGNAMITCAALLTITSTLLGMKEAITNEEVFSLVQSKPKFVISLITIWRLVDDIWTYEVEKAKGQGVTGIECYMNQYGVSKEDAIKEFNNKIEKAWKIFNEEYIKPTPIPKYLMDRVINSARLMVVCYNKCDPFTYPEITLKDMMVSVLVNPIPLD